MIRYFITKLEPKHKIKDYTITFLRIILSKNNRWCVNCYAIFMWLEWFLNINICRLLILYRIYNFDLLYMQFVNNGQLRQIYHHWVLIYYIKQLRRLLSTLILNYTSISTIFTTTSSVSNDKTKNFIQKIKTWLLVSWTSDVISLAHRVITTR